MLLANSYFGWTLMKISSQKFGSKISSNGHLDRVMSSHNCYLGLPIFSDVNNHKSRLKMNNEIFSFRTINLIHYHHCCVGCLIVKRKRDWKVDKILSFWKGDWTLIKANIWLGNFFTSFPMAITTTHEKRNTSSIANKNWCSRCCYIY